MFTDDMMRDYFLEIRKIEQQMEAAYRGIAAALKDPYYRDIFQALADDERRHDKKVEELIELFII